MSTAKKEEKKKAPPPAEEEDMGFSLFDSVWGGIGETIKIIFLHVGRAERRPSLCTSACDQLKRAVGAAMIVQPKRHCEEQL